MNKRHITEQYYSIRIKTQTGKVVVVDTSGWNGSVENLAELINKLTNKNWQKLTAYKYTQNIDLHTKFGSKIVNKKRSRLDVIRNGTDSFCTKVDENLMRNGKIPQNIYAFFGNSNDR